MTTIILSGGDLGNETMLVRCNLSEASAPVQADYMTGEGDGWCATQYQCADCRHTVSGLAEIGRLLAASAVEVPDHMFRCDWEEVATYTGRNIMEKYIVTAEHCGGKSVDHPCTRGVYADPANDLDLLIEASSESEAIAAGMKWLEERCAEAGECDCQRRLSPGGNAWWDSVAVHAAPVGLAEIRGTTK